MSDSSSEVGSPTAFLGPETNTPGPAPTGQVIVSPASVRSELISVLQAQEGFDQHAISDASVNLDGDDSETKYLGLFIDVVRHFTSTNPRGTISSYLDRVVEEPLHSQLFGPSASNDDKKSIAERGVLSVLGTWFGLSPLFRQAVGKMRLRPILLVRDRYNELAMERDLAVTVENLLESSIFIPKRSETKEVEIPEKVDDVDEVLALVESTQIDREFLNALTLQNYAHVDILWVNNISRHMILSNRTGHDVLELFGFPHVTRMNDPLGRKHAFVAYKAEVWKSYALLFPIEGAVQHRGIFNRLVFRSVLCWCKSCKIRRMIEKQNNGCKYASSAIFTALTEKRLSWNTDEFPILWHRILKLRDHQASAKPGTVKALWKDRRNPVQFYGILFAAVVIPFSIITIALAGATLAYAVKGPQVSNPAPSTPSSPTPTSP